MKYQVLVLAALALIGTLSYVGYRSCHGVSSVDQLWEDWKEEYSKEYGLQGEESQRKEVFKTNNKFIEDTNNAGLSYKVGHNQFSDLTTEEFKAAYHGYNHVEKEQQNVQILDTTDLPATVDWVKAGAVNAIKNQEQCGSCWAFSAVAAMEGAGFVEHGKLLSLSEQQLVDCDKVDDGCSGGLMDNAFTYAETHKMDLESAYAYTGHGSLFGCYSSWYKGQVEVQAFKDVPTNNEQQLMAAVTQQPVSIAIEADQSSFQFYKSGVFTGTCGANLDHGVAAVGFGTEGGADYWLVRNSWATTWGEAGYMKMARGLKVNSGSGQCGILKQPSYPSMD